MRLMYDLAMREGGKLDKRSIWASSRGIQLPPNMASRIVEPLWPAVDVRIYSGACSTVGGLAAVDFFANHGGGLPVLLRSTAENELIRS